MEFIYHFRAVQPDLVIALSPCNSKVYALIGRWVHQNRALGPSRADIAPPRSGAPKIIVDIHDAPGVYISRTLTPTNGDGDV